MNIGYIDDASKRQPDEECEIYQGQTEMMTTMWFICLSCTVIKSNKLHSSTCDTSVLSQYMLERYLANQHIAILYPW